MCGTTLAAAVTVLLSVSGGGCQVSSSTSAVTPEVDGKIYLLAAEPAEARSVTEVRDALAASDTPADVVIVGRVGGLSQPTWDPEQAAFMMADLSLSEPEAEDSATYDPAPAHDADNCPFCRAKKKKELAGLALVQIVDVGGRVPAVDARQLLGLSDGDTIVVPGQAHIDKLGALVVRSSGIYVRPRAEE
jgi:hypothetical protein